MKIYVAKIHNETSFRTDMSELGLEGHEFWTPLLDIQAWEQPST